MTGIVMARAGETGLPGEALQAMYKFRNKVFNERLGWEVQSFDGMEIDAYDGLGPVYMLSHGEIGKVSGCWRLLPTEGPYMLKNTFPQLLRGETVPESPRIWELSRFAVHSDSNGDLAQGQMGETTFSMIRRVYEFAVLNGIQQYVTVTSVALERMMKKAGFPMRRFGDGKAQRVGKVLSVACWIDINEQFRKAAYESQQSLKVREAA